MARRNPHKDMLDAADAAVAYATQVRRYHRRRTDRSSRQRETDIEVALQRLRVAMRPLKSEIGRFTYGPQSEEAETHRQRIRDASQRIQSERRKLWKMRPRKTQSLEV